MKRFSDFAEQAMLDGDKIRIDNVLNQEICITGYRIKVSKFSKNNSGKYLTMQFYFGGDGNQSHILFTGSDVLISQLERYGEEIPFWATIKKIDRYYTLT